MQCPTLWLVLCNVILYLCCYNATMLQCSYNALSNVPKCPLAHLLLFNLLCGQFDYNLLLRQGSPNHHHHDHQTLIKIIIVTVLAD